MEQSVFSFVLYCLIFSEYWSYISSEIPVLQVLYIEFYIFQNNFRLQFLYLYFSLIVCIDDLYAKNELNQYLHPVFLSFVLHYRCWYLPFLQYWSVLFLRIGCCSNVCKKNTIRKYCTEKKSIKEQ